MPGVTQPLGVRGLSSLVLGELLNEQEVAVTRVWHSEWPPE